MHYEYEINKKGSTDQVNLIRIVKNLGLERKSACFHLVSNKAVFLSVMEIEHQAGPLSLFQFALNAVVYL